MRTVAAILDCYTVEPSGLGVPPYLSTYARAAYSALRRADPTAAVRYVTIDDVRWCWNGGRPFTDPPLSDPLTYSTTTNRDQALQLLADASVVVVIAGDAVPSVHLHARNGSLEEIVRALAPVRGQRVLLGPLASQLHTADPGSGSGAAGAFTAVHTHTVTSGDLLLGSRAAAPYARLAADRDSDGYGGLLEQLGWEAIAEVELYRGCTRRRYCSFCNEPVKAAQVDFRAVDDILAEVSGLYAAGVRNFRLGQQTCFFSYQHRDVGSIQRLLASIRERCPELEVLHIDNADPLAVASKTGAKIARLVATYCTEGNCAPMGVESFDPVVVERNRLTCTPEVLMRAIAHVNEVGAQSGPLGLPRLLPGLNLIYGLPGETHRTHQDNLHWLVRILEAGYACHRTNVRQARTYPATPLAAMPRPTPPPSAELFATWKDEVAQVYDLPMKQRVYPTGQRISGQHAFFVTERGSWHRRLGSYSLQIVEPGTIRSRGEPAALRITGHAPRYVYGVRDAA